MTQKILDCLLIKSKFILMDKQELVEQIISENLEKSVINSIYEIMSTDNFLFSNQKLLEKLEYLLTKIRFARCMDSETIQDMNAIISRINIFKAMHKETQQIIQDNWLDYEISNLRMLPYSKKITSSDLYQIITTDYTYIHGLVENDKLDIYDPISFIASLNLVSNQYLSIYLENPTILLSAIPIVKELQKQFIFQAKFSYAATAKQSVKKLIEIKNAFQQIDSMDSEYEIQLQKRKKV